MCFTKSCVEALFCAIKFEKTVKHKKKNTILIGAYRYFFNDTAENGRKIIKMIELGTQFF